MKNTQIVDCPDASSIPIPATPLPYAYAMNLHVTQVMKVPGTTVNNNMGMVESAIERSAGTVFFADAARHNGTTVVRFPNLFAPSYAVGSASYSTVHGRHNGIANVGWLDGRAKGMKMSFPNAKPNGLKGAAANIGDLVSPQHPYNAE